MGYFTHYWPDSQMPLAHPPPDPHQSSGQEVREDWFEWNFAEMPCWVERNVVVVSDALWNGDPGCSAGNNRTCNQRTSSYNTIYTLPYALHCLHKHTLYIQYICDSSPQPSSHRYCTTLKLHLRPEYKKYTFQCTELMDNIQFKILFILLVESE